MSRSMRLIGFTADTVVGPASAARVPVSRTEIIALPKHAAEDVLATTREACDLTPCATAEAWPMTTPSRLTLAQWYVCGLCAGTVHMTRCWLCNSTKRVAVIGGLIRSKYPLVATKVQP